MSPTLPGTPTHQAILRACLACFQAAAHWQHLGLFGSLARGDWTDLSDVDLNVVVAEGAGVVPLTEVELLRPHLAAENLLPRLVIPESTDSVNLVLPSLIGISIRFHALADTSPNIVGHLLTLATRIEPETVLAAGRANHARRASPLSVERLVDECLRCCVEAEAAVQRQRLWLAQDLLTRARGCLMALYAAPRAALRPLHFFDSAAPPELQARLAATLAVHEPASLRASISHLLDLVEFDLNIIVGWPEERTAGQQAVIASLRARLAP